MCGIGGIVRWGDTPISEEQIGFLLVGNEHRGNDASGLVIQQADGSLDILKKDIPGWKLFASQEYKDFIKDKLNPTSKAVLVHARAASVGNPRDNNNNHPISAGLSAVVHNGVIRNSDDLFRNFKLERKADPDTDIARAIFDKWGFTKKAIEMLGKGTGSGAIAAVHPEYPNKLMLVRSGNPLTLASNKDFFFFSSEKDTLYRACRTYIERKGIWFQAQRPDADFTTMVDHTGWIIGPDGLEEHHECHICTGAYLEPWRKTYEEYEKRQEKWNTRARVTVGVLDTKTMKPAWCYDCKKEWMIPGNGIYSQYTCNKDEGGCGRTLWMPKGKADVHLGRVN